MAMEQETRALAVVSESQQFNQRQLDIIKNQIAKGANDDDLGLFLEVCKLTGLNPFQRQIYAVMRGGRMTIQTGIDGYRLIAARTGQLAGIDDPQYDSEDGDHPNKATVTVWRFVKNQRVPFTATARWREYVQPSGGLWSKMPYLMLGKCAEALALRKAFPAELSGVYTGEEMSQADNDPAPYIEAEPVRPSAPRPTKIVPTPTWAALRKDSLVVGLANMEAWEQFVKATTGKTDPKAYTEDDRRKVADALAEMRAKRDADAEAGPDLHELGTGYLAG
jgi:phage recombination protein Bet